MANYATAQATTLVSDCFLIALPYFRLLASFTWLLLLEPTNLLLPTGLQPPDGEEAFLNVYIEILKEL